MVKLYGFFLLFLFWWLFDLFTLLNCMLLPKKFIFLVYLRETSLLFYDFLWRMSSIFSLFRSFLDTFKIICQLCPVLLKLDDGIHWLSQSTAAHYKIWHGLLSSRIYSFRIIIYSFLSILNCQIFSDLLWGVIWINNFDDSLHPSVYLTFVSELSCFIKRKHKIFLILITQNRWFYIRTDHGRIIDEWYHMCSWLVSRATWISKTTKFYCITLLNL